MCLLFWKPADVTFEDAWLTDFYTRNQDGYGVMYFEDGKVVYEKAIGKVQDWIKFFRSHEHREACFHLRMRTHGNIDMENTHPYVVRGFDKFDENETPMLLMHNGVLHTDNSRDKTKSDTWHYIRDYIRPLIANDPLMVHEPYFQDVIGKHIGSNRFAMLDRTGKFVIINKQQGVTWRNVWFSNTYAWSATKAMPPKHQSYVSDYRGSFGNPAARFDTSKPKAQKELPLKPKGKRVKKDEVPSLANWPDAESVEIQQLADEILFVSGDVYEKVTYNKLRRMLKDLGSNTAWEIVTGFVNGDLTDKQLYDILDDPRKAKEFVNTGVLKYA
jgi:hypothetical protein